MLSNDSSSLTHDGCLETRQPQLQRAARQQSIHKFHDCTYIYMDIYIYIYTQMNVFCFLPFQPKLKVGTAFLLFLPAFGLAGFIQLPCK
jgi:hypothetical protein